MLSFFNIICSKTWFDSEYRSKNWPSTEYYKQYSTGANEKEALDNAKKELSKSILSQIETKSTSTGITKNGIYNDLFKEKSSETSSATFVNLNKELLLLIEIKHVMFLFTRKNLS